MDCDQESSKNVKNHKMDDNHPKERKNRNEQDEKKKCRKRRSSPSSSDSRTSSESSSSSSDDGKKRETRKSHSHTSLSLLDKRLPSDSNPTESKNDYQQKVFLFLEQVDYDSDEKENVRRFLLENAPKRNDDRTQEKKSNLEELEKAPSPVNNPLVHPGSLTVLDKFGNLRLICPNKGNDRTNVSRSSRSRSSRRTSRDRSNRMDRETYNRPRNSWNNRRNRERRYRSRSRETRRTSRRRFEESRKPEKFYESKNITIPDETNLEEMEDFLARVREAKRKKMLEENKDL